MSFADNKHSVVVGIFVFIGIAIFVAAVLTLGGQQKRFVQSIKVRTVVADAEGLKVGNNVRFSGVKVGTIKEVRFAGSSQVEITMNIDQEAQQYIHKDAKVRIGAESLIGNKNLVVSGGSAQAPVVEDNDVLKAERTLSSEDLMATLQENNKNLVSITTDLKKVSAGIARGQGTLGKLVSDTVMAHNFQQIISNLEQVSVTTAKASGALAQFSTKLNRQDGLANQLLTDTVTFRHLKNSLAKLDQATGSAKELTANLSQASAKLNNQDNAMGVILNDPKFAGNLKNTMANLETSTQKLDEDLEALQSSFLFKEFFKIKARKGKQKVVPEKN
jgi:phospholipid/cholesterol/gamma-HCH transport system substrate-binding protein